MKNLLEVRRDKTATHSMLYLRYAENPRVAKTISLTDDEAVALDLAEDGSVVGIELINPRNADFEMLLSIAKERDLSLDGLFSYA